MPEVAKKHMYTKSRLVKELSWKTELPQGKVKDLLTALAEIACREARDTFVLPGLCKFELAHRKERKIRNPRTGDVLMLPEHDTLRIVAARAAKLAVAPKVTAIPLAEYEATHPKSEPPAAPVVESPAAPVAEPPAAPAAEQPAAAPVAEATAAPDPTPVPAQASDGFVTFFCPRCHQEIEASYDMVGEEAECPACGNILKVPSASEKGSTRDAPGQASDPQPQKEVVSAAEAANLYPAMMKSRTIRIDSASLGLSESTDEEVGMVSFRCHHCHQEIEASQDMIGEEAQCPNCSTMLLVPKQSEPGTLHAQSLDLNPQQLQAMKSRTMRIDMPDDF